MRLGRISTQVPITTNKIAIVCVLELICLQNNNSFRCQRPGSISTAPLILTVHRESSRVEPVSLNYQWIPFYCFIIRWQIQSPQQFDALGAFPLKGFYVPQIELA